MNRLILLILIQLSCCAVSSSADSAPCGLVPNALRTVERIRGLKVKREVPCFARNRDEVRKHLISLVRDKIPPEKIRLEELVLKRIGFIPRYFDYEKGLIDLYVSQLGGYYDPDGELFVMASWIPKALQGSVAIHELTHAVQDQHFALERFIDQRSDSSDILLARSALVEGDATAVMIDAMNLNSGTVPVSKMESVEELITQTILGAEFTGEAAKTPSSLQLMVLFPYTSGLRFAHTLLRDGGYTTIDQAYRRPPRSTEEILHPTKYLSRSEDFKNIIPSEVQDSAWGEIIYRDSLGEFMISALLEEISSDRAKTSLAATGWGGDLLVVQRAREDTTSLLLSWKIAWDSKRDLDEFSKLYSPFLEDRRSRGEEITVSQLGRDMLIRFKVK